MDEMKIQSGFMKALLSNIVRTKLKKKLGENCKVEIHKFGFVNNGERTTINIGVDLEVDTSEIPEILKQLGLM